MNEKFKSSLTKFIIAITLISLFIGIIQKLFIDDESEVYEEITENNVVLMPEHYIENQVAFINWEQIYEYFPTIKGAENFKKDVTKNLLERMPNIKCWFVEEVNYSNNVLSFRVVYNNFAYKIMINEYQTLITKE